MVVDKGEPTDQHALEDLIVFLDGGTNGGWRTENCTSPELMYPGCGVGGESCNEWILDREEYWLGDERSILKYHEPGLDPVPSLKASRETVDSSEPKIMLPFLHLSLQFQDPLQLLKILEKVFPYPIFNCSSNEGSWGQATQRYGGSDSLINFRFLGSSSDWFVIKEIDPKASRGIHHPWSKPGLRVLARTLNYSRVGSAWAVCMGAGFQLEASSAASVSLYVRSESDVDEDSWITFSYVSSSG
ncbi:hypothetical protein Tco_0588254 [Tanacetum coccineum]